MRGPVPGGGSLTTSTPTAMGRFAPTTSCAGGVSRCCSCTTASPGSRTSAPP